MHLKSSRKIVIILLLLGICHSVYPLRPSALLKRAFLRSRLMALPTFAVNGTMRLKRQLFREDIPHSRPLTGNTYYLHAGFPHPSRWHEGPQIIGPNPNPITHHHLQHHQRPGLHDDLHNNHLNSQHHHDHHENQLLHPHDPPKVQLVHTEEPHTVTIQSAIVHGGGDFGGGIIDNSLGHHHHPSPAPHHHQHHQQHHQHHDQFNHIHPPNPGHIRHNILRKRPNHPKPHSEPEPFGEDIDPGHYGLRDHGHYGPVGSAAPPYEPPKSIPVNIVHNQPPRKPKTIIHYHPVTVGNIININDDGQKSLAYGPPKHVPGEPLGHSHHHQPPPHHHHHQPHPHKDVMLSMAEPFIKTPFKTVNGPPDFLDFGKEPISYGPPDHAPGHPLGHHDLAPMLPSYGPPVKEEPISPYNVALPVLAHLHSTDHHHHHHHHPPPPPPPRKRHRGGRHHHHRGPPRRHHLHFHHIHHDHPPPPPPPPHPPGALGSPFFQPTYVVHGHVPSKFVSLHSPHFKSHAVSHHHHRRAWAL